MKKNNNKNNNWISRIKIGNTGNIFLAKFYSLKYAGSTTLGCKHIVIRKSELVAKTQFLYLQTKLLSLF